MGVREIDFISESEDSLRDKLTPLPLSPREQVFAANQLIQNNKCIDIYEKILKQLIFEDKKFLTMIAKASLTQTKNQIYFSKFLDTIQELNYKTKESIIQDTFQSTCTSMRDEMFDYCLSVIQDASFKDNVIFFLLRNNQNLNMNKVKIRPEVIHQGFVSNQEEIIENIDKDKFYFKHPEFYL
jgi:hypothetical protein